MEKWNYVEEKMEGEFVGIWICEDTGEEYVDNEIMIADITPKTFLLDDEDREYMLKRAKMIACCPEILDVMKEAMYNAVADQTSIHMAEACVRGFPLPENISFPIWVQKAHKLIIKLKGETNES